MCALVEGTVTDVRIILTAEWELFAGGQEIFPRHGRYRFRWAIQWEDLVLRRIRRMKFRQGGVVTHNCTVPRAALETSAGQKMLIRWTAMSCKWNGRIVTVISASIRSQVKYSALTDIRAFAVDAVDKQFDCPDMVTGKQHPTGLFNAIFDQRQWDQCAALLRQRASRLFLPIVWIEIDVTAWLRHTVSGHF